MQIQRSRHTVRRLTQSASAMHVPLWMPLALLSAACGQDASAPAAPTPVTPTRAPSCAAPTMQPTPGTFPPVTLSVTLQSATPGAAIHFTLDGTAANASSPLYERPITVASTATLKAVATCANIQDSSASSGHYEFVRQRVTMAGRVLYDRDVISGRTSDAASFLLGDETPPYRELDGVITYYDVSTGQYAMTNLPQHPIGVDTSFGRTSAHPVDGYYSWTVLDLTSADTVRTESVDLHVSRLIHLVAPVDNASTLPDGDGEFASPVRFQWDPIAEAARYSVWIYSHRAGTNTSEEAFYDDALRGTDLPVDLTPLAAPDHYEFVLRGYSSAGDCVGVLEIQTTTGRSSTYRFRVK
jgi:hypothetical protein